MTKTQTLAAIKALGLKVSCVDGEYRIAPKGLTAENEERKAAYTDDAEDALDTAKAIAKQLASASNSPLSDAAYDALNDLQDRFVPISDEFQSARKAFAKSKSQVRRIRLELAESAFDNAFDIITAAHNAYAAAQEADAANQAAEALKVEQAASPTFTF